MNAAALAAVVAAANLLLARASERQSDVSPNGSRWGIAGRLRVADARDARRVADARSRWAMEGRIRD